MSVYVAKIAMLILDGIKSSLASLTKMKSRLDLEQ